MATRKKEIKFEEAILRLEEIASAMESKNLSLEESLKMFQEGMDIALLCNKKLDEAEKRIDIIVKNSKGSLVEEEFEPEGE